MPVSRKTKLLIRLSLFAAAFVFALIRFFDLSVPDSSLDQFVGKKFRFRGTVLESPEIRNGSPRFKFYASEFLADGTWFQIESQKSEPPTVLVRSRHLGEVVRYGDMLEFDASVKVPDLIESEDGRTFNYRSFLAKDDIYYILEARDLEVVGSGFGNSVTSFLYSVKSRIVENIESSLPSPHAFLASGLIISGKGSMSKELQEKFQIAGLIHIVVLSGSNVSIIGDAILKVFGFLPKTIASVCGGLGIVGFAVMTGGGATVVRSTVMSLIALYARLTNRTNAALMSLTVAGSLMLVHNPKILFHDPSFQLSFLASLGLILYSERVKVRIMFLKTKFKVPESVVDLIACTFATQLFTLPFIIHMSGLFSVIALAVNIIVLPVIPLTMLLVFVVSVLSFISGAVASVPAFVSWILLSYELKVVDIAASISWSHILIPPIPVSWILVSYAVFILDIAVYEYRFMGKKEKMPQLNT
ncbi:MAG TPA: ComEC/Rec2 family competence protein [Candidatus Paceibacterota bacterium]